MTTRPHGYARYKLDRCRCPRCTAASRDYDANRRRLIAYGQWRHLADAEPARQHIRMLGDFGLGWVRVARLAGVPQYTVHRLLYGTPAEGRPPTRRIKQATADKILAVRLDLDALPATAKVDSAGTRRRIQALCVVGWSISEQARQIGVWPANLNAVLHARKCVTVATARLVRDLADRLWTQPPPETTKPERISASYARSMARKHGWLPLAAWDDDLIDLPDEWLDKAITEQVAGMGMAELAAAWTARYKHGDKCPLIVAAAREYKRRRKAEALAARAEVAA